jgi:hypothetical protein
MLKKILPRRCLANTPEDDLTVIEALGQHLQGWFDRSRLLANTPRMIGQRSRRSRDLCPIIQGVLTKSWDLCQIIWGGAGPKLRPVKSFEGVLARHLRGVFLPVLCEPKASTIQENTIDEGSMPESLCEQHPPIGASPFVEYLLYTSMGVSLDYWTVYNNILIGLNLFCFSQMWKYFFLAKIVTPVQHMFNRMSSMSYFLYCYHSHSHRKVEKTRIINSDYRSRGANLSLLLVRVQQSPGSILVAVAGCAETMSGWSPLCMVADEKSWFNVVDDIDMDIVE